MTAVGIGLISESGVSLGDVLYCPEVTENLLSVSKLEDEGYDTLFRDGEVLVGKGTTMEKVALRGFRRGASYFLDFPTRNNPSSASAITVDELHLRLNHLNGADIGKLYSHQLADDLPQLSDRILSPCDGCAIGKARKGSSPKTTAHRATRPGELIHSDICGPIKPFSLTGHLYVLTMTDDYSRFTFVYLLRSKSELPSIVEKFAALINNRFGRHITILRSDNEYRNNNELNRFCEKHGIEQQYTTPYQSTQNGVSERTNLTLLNPARALLTHANVGQEFWDEAVLSTCYSRNVSPTTAISPQTTPYELFYGSKPTLGHLRVFGEKCFAVTQLHHRQATGHTKLAARSVECLFLGYSLDSKSYRLWCVGSSKVILARYEDTTFPKSQKITTKMPTEVSADDDAVLPLIPPVNTYPATPAIHPVALSDESTDDGFHSAASEVDTDDDQELPVNPPPVAAQQLPLAVNDILALPAQRKRTVRFDYSAAFQTGVEEEDPTFYPGDKGGPYNKRTSGIDRSAVTETVTNGDQPPHLKHGTIPNTHNIPLDELSLLPAIDFLPLLGCEWYQLPPSAALSATGDILPTTYDDIAELVDRDEWNKATDSEIATLIEHGTWELVPLPKGRKAIKSKWVFRIKRDADGAVTRYKARLCACGYSQVAGVDYKDIYAPVVRAESLRLVLSTEQSIHSSNRSVLTRSKPIRASTYDGKAM